MKAFLSKRSVAVDMSLLKVGGKIKEKCFWIHPVPVLKFMMDYGDKTLNL